MKTDKEIFEATKLDAARAFQKIMERENPRGTLSEKTYGALVNSLVASFEAGYALAFAVIEHTRRDDRTAVDLAAGLEEVLENPSTKNFNPENGG